jgi:hypothetical protein
MRLLRKEYWATEDWAFCKHSRIIFPFILYLAPSSVAVLHILDPLSA